MDVIKVSDDGLVAILYVPSTSAGRRSPALIVLSGSDGGIASAAMYGEPLAALRYVVLAMAYFAMDGLPRDLVQIPLEYFKRAVDWLQAHPAVDVERIGMLGHSRGGSGASHRGNMSKHPSGRRERSESGCLERDSCGGNHRLRLDARWYRRPVRPARSAAARWHRVE